MRCCPKSIITLDAGTTPLEMISYLDESTEFICITTSLIAATRLCGYPGIDVISVGGNVHKSSYSVSNYMAIEALGKYRSDVAFISTRAIMLPDGIFEADLSLIEIKRAIAVNAKKVVLLADHTKWQCRSLALSVPMDSIDTVITDTRAPAAQVEQVRRAGITVYTV